MTVSGHRYSAGTIGKGGVDTMEKLESTLFDDPDMRRAWTAAIASEREAEKHPERTAEQRRRLVRWSARRTSIA